MIWLRKINNGHSDAQRNNWLIVQTVQQANWHVYYHYATMMLCLFQYLTAPSGLLLRLWWRGCAAASTKAGTRHRVGMGVIIWCLTATILECLHIIQMLVWLHVDAKVSFGGSWIIAYLKEMDCLKKTTNNKTLKAFMTNSERYLMNE